MLGQKFFEKWCCILQSKIAPLTPSNPPFLFVICSASFILLSLFFHLLLSQTLPSHSHFLCSLCSHPSRLQFCFLFTSTFSAYINILLSFPLPPTFSSFAWPFISLLHFIPISLCMHVSMCVCFCVCVAAGSSWLFFRQQPRRLDCHNLWSWVISVSNPNWGTGPFFLSSSSPPTPSPPLSFSFPPLCSLLSHHLSLFLPFSCHYALPFIFCTGGNSNSCYWSPPTSCHLSCTKFRIYY